VQILVVNNYGVWFCSCVLHYCVDFNSLSYILRYISCELNVHIIMVAGIASLELQTFRTKDLSFPTTKRKVPMENFRSPVTKVPGTFVPRNESSLELSFPGPFNSTQRAFMDAGVKTPQCPHLG